MATNKNSKTTFASVLLTFFIDNLCWSIVFPIFAPYFLDPENVVFSPEVPESKRTLILGFFLMAFSLGQFLGAPIVGEYGDRHGRKKALILTVLFTLFGLLLTAWSMGNHYLIVLFLGRFITGLFASNTSICLACVSDLSESEQSKSKNFGYFSFMAGLSFIVGAFVGGKLADPTISEMFSPNLPIWIAAGLTTLNLLFVFFGFQETSEFDPSVKFNLFESFRNIQSALQIRKIQKIYLVYFLFLFAWTILFQFFPVITVHKFSFTSSNIGDLALFMGICWALGSIYINKLLSRYFSSLRVLEACLLLFTFLCGLIILPKHIYTLISLLGGCVMIGGLAWPLCTGTISSLAPRHVQGKIMGMSQSIQSLSMAVAPLVGGVAVQFSFSLPFLIGSAASCLAAIVYFTLKEQ